MATLSQRNALGSPHHGRKEEEEEKKEKEGLTPATAQIKTQDSPGLLATNQNGPRLWWQNSWEPLHFINFIKSI